MDRRTTLLALSGAALPLVLARADVVLPTGGGSFADYRKQTLQYGWLAKDTSIYAHKTSQNTYVQDFAHGEILEQTAIAEALTHNANPPPPALTPAQQQMLREVRSAGPSTVDAVYIQVQTAGHEALLKLQDQLLSADKNLSSDIVHIALIARAFILNHLIVLRLLSGQ